MFRWGSTSIILDRSISTDHPKTLIKFLKIWHTKYQSRHHSTTGHCDLKSSKISIWEWFSSNKANSLKNFFQRWVTLEIRLTSEIKIIFECWFWPLMYTILHYFLEPLFSEGNNLLEVVLHLSSQFSINLTTSPSIWRKNICTMYDVYIKILKQQFIRYWFFI